jgi:hypothetical protein
VVAIGYHTLGLAFKTAHSDGCSFGGYFAVLKMINQHLYERGARNWACRMTHCSRNGGILTVSWWELFLSNAEWTTRTSEDEVDIPSAADSSDILSWRKTKNGDRISGTRARANTEGQNTQRPCYVQMQGREMK